MLFRSEKKAAELEKKLRENSFTLTDYLDQLHQLKNMVSLESLIGMIPVMKIGEMKDAKIDENALKHTEAIILSMTVAERERPELINGSRRKRIAAGSGTSVEEVNRLMKQYDQMNKMFKQLGGMGRKGKGKKKLKMPFSF